MTGSSTSRPCRCRASISSHNTRVPDGTISLMNRRDLFKTAAAMAAVPLAAGQPGTAWKPLLFDDHQNQTVIALTELILPATDTPGAKAAQVNRYLDLLLRDGDSAAREHFLSGLNALDGSSLRAYGRPFISCTAAQQTAMLAALDQKGDRFFHLAKELTTEIYYSTEIGFRELNKGGRVPATFGCRHPSHG